MKQRRALVYVFMFGMIGLAACGKTEPPPPPKAEPAKVAAPEVNEELKRLAGEVYVYGYPLVVTDVTRQVTTSDVPINTFAHKRTVPDASTVDVVRPNADFLHSQAWLDLSKEPVVLSIPDTRGRYYLVAMLDAWSNVASSLGKRTTGTEKREIAIVGPRWKGTLPADVTEINSPTELAWLFGRTEVKGKGDRAAAAKIQEQFKVTPLSQRGKRGGKAATEAQAGVAGKTDLREQVARMDAAAFFTRLAALIPGNPPAADDKPMLEKIQKLGIVAGQPFAMGKLDPVASRSIEQGVQQARDAIVVGAKGTGGADIRNGWAVDRALGRWGSDYGKRAVAAMNGLGVNAPEDAIFMIARFDGGGRRLEGANRYVLHFDKNALPPTDAFWSLSLYDDEQHFVANVLNRHNILSTDAIRPNADGSLDIYVQNADPGKEKEANWLPAPKENFHLILRVYWPRPEVVDGTWVAPGIRRAS